MVVGTLVSMLVPMPPMILDFLIGANLIFALALLLSALALTDTLKLSSLPSLLLLATVFRLALNISSTRNILGNGHGGQIIEAFGKIVVNGNLIVGIVIFLVITLVQFIVVAKGSERVAEVAARFTLDALPGKQMAIDADLRAGVLDMNQARQKRQDLQTESRFYGALDGAMKFVKGDAIAGIVITIINLLGGIVVGVVIAKLDFATAVQKYSLLTVGDGLASQIPSLLNSLAAGIVVTRVSRGDDRTLAQDLMQQLSAVRSIKVIIGFFSIGLACVPDMPMLPFLTLGSLLLISSLMPQADAENERVVVAPWVPRSPALISVAIDRASYARLFTKTEQLSVLNGAVREAIFKEQGLLLPNIEFIPDTSDSGVVLQIRDIPVEKLESLNIVADLEARLVGMVRGHTAELIDDSMTRRLLDSQDPVTAESVNTVIPTVVSVTQVTELLKNLVSEGVSIKSFDVILQAISEHASRSPSARVLLEEVRIAMKRTVCARVLNLSMPAQPTQAMRLNAIADYEISKLERDGLPLTLALMEQVGAFLKDNSATQLLVVSRGARRLIKQLAELHRLPIYVIAFEELVETATLNFVASFEAEPEFEPLNEERMAA